MSECVSDYDIINNKWVTFISVELLTLNSKGNIANSITHCEWPFDYYLMEHCFIALHNNKSWTLLHNLLYKLYGPSTNLRKDSAYLLQLLFYYNSAENLWRILPASCHSQPLSYNSTKFLGPFFILSPRACKWIMWYIKNMYTVQVRQYFSVDIIQLVRLISYKNIVVQPNISSPIYILL